MQTAHLVAEADQLAAEARDARCCDPFDPCDRCRRLRQAVVARRRVAGIPAQRGPGAGSVPGRT